MDVSDYRSRYVDCGWLINTYVPMDSKIKTILNVVVVIAVILWLLQGFGVIGPLRGIRVE